jgi:hypothetical protein
MTDADHAEITRMYRDGMLMEPPATGEPVGTPSWYGTVSVVWTPDEQARLDHVRAHGVPGDRLRQMASTASWVKALESCGMGKLAIVAATGACERTVDRALGRLNATTAVRGVGTRVPTYLAHGWLAGREGERYGVTRGV